MNSDPSVEHAFAEATSGLSGIERRKMFGYPAVFINGNMAAGLHRDGIVLRLNAEDRQVLFAEGRATPFVAMGGRVMREWVVAPPAMATSADDLWAWLGRALNHTGGLPAKAKTAEEGCSTSKLNESRA